LTGWWSPTDPHSPVLQAIARSISAPERAPATLGDGRRRAHQFAREQQARVEQEAERIRQIAALARPYGCKSGTLHHNRWFGVMDNEVAIIERLKQNRRDRCGDRFTTSATGHHHIADFPAIWKRMQPYVVAVNVTGNGGGRRKEKSCRLRKGEFELGHVAGHRG